MKKYLKSFLVLLSSFILILSMNSCKDSDESGDENAEKDDGSTVILNVYNWGEYISDGFEGSMDVNREFEKYYYELTGKKVKVNYTTYATNEDMYSKLKSGAGSYDIVIPSDYMIQKMISEDMLIPFGAQTIPNYVNIDEQFKNVYYDPDNMYSVPYTYGMVGIIYNEQLVDPEDYERQSWDLLWDEKYRGKILQFNNPRDAFGSAMYLLSLDINSTDREAWNKALDKLKMQKPLIQAYVNDEIFNKMTTASAAIAPYFAGDFVTMAYTNEDLKFYYPKEGTNLFFDSMCIPKSSKNVDIAKEYINFMLTEEVAVENAIYIGYASPNKLVVKNEYYIESMGETAMDILYSASPKDLNAEYNALYGTTCYESFSPDIQLYVNTLWESLKTENSTELWIHVTTIAIVVSVFALYGYSTYTKKKRSRHYRIKK